MRASRKETSYRKAAVLPGADGRFASLGPRKDLILLTNCEFMTEYAEISGPMRARWRVGDTLEKSE